MTSEFDARLSAPARLAALRATGLLDGTRDEVLDRLTRLVTKLLGVPVAMISLVDDRRQHFPGLSRVNGDPDEPRGNSLEYSYCKYVVTRDATLLIEDAGADPLVHDSLAFTELGLVAYAGVPLRTADGQTLGALCAMDDKPLTWSADQVETLEDLASAAMAEIELRATVRALIESRNKLKSQAAHDELTGLLNRRGFNEQAKRQFALARRTKAAFLVVALDLDGFKSINDTFGHDVGDHALVDMSAVLDATCRETDLVARVGGDEFVLLITNTGADEVDRVRERVRSAVAEQNAKAMREYRLATSIGIAAWAPGSAQTLADLQRLADDAMYEDKRARKQRAEQAQGNIALH